MIVCLDIERQGTEGDGYHLETGRGHRQLVHALAALVVAVIAVAAGSGDRAEARIAVERCGLTCGNDCLQKRVQAHEYDNGPPIRPWHPNSVPARAPPFGMGAFEGSNLGANSRRLSPKSYVAFSSVPSTGPTDASSWHGEQNSPAALRPLWRCQLLTTEGSEAAKRSHR